MPESEPARLPRKMLLCALAEFVEPEGVKSDRGLNGGSHAAGNIGNTVAQIFEIIKRVYVLVTCDQRQTQSVQARGILDHIFRLKCILG
jgi:hypothetical protein